MISEITDGLEPATVAFGWLNPWYGSPIVLPLRGEFASLRLRATQATSRASGSHLPSSFARTKLVFSPSIGITHPVDFRPSVAAFATTRWSLVLAAGGDASPAGRAALNDRCQAYWPPVYAYARRAGHPPEDARDLPMNRSLNAKGE